MLGRVNPFACRAAKLTSCLLVVIAMCAAFVTPEAQASTPAPAWTVTVISGPTNFTAGDHTGRDAYLVTATNTGGAPTNQSEAITLRDTLPAGVTLETEEKGDLEELDGNDEAGNPAFSIGKGTCKAGPPIECTDSQGTHAIEPGESVLMRIPIDVASNASTGALDVVELSGGGAQSVSASLPTTITPLPAPAGFLVGANGFDGAVTNADGSTLSQAGAHPYQATLSFTLNSEIMHGKPVASGEPKTVTADLPPGVIVNPNATATRCTEAELETDGNVGGGCPDASQVGTVRVTSGLFGFPSFQTARLYNMVPPHGWTADLGFDAIGLGIYVHLRGFVRTGGDYGLSATSPDILQEGQILGFSATLWGNPSDPSHDAVRGHCFNAGENVTGALCPGVSTNTALLTLPTKCSGPLTTAIEVESWQEPNKLIPDSFISHDGTGASVGVTGCSVLDFSPSITAKPEPEAATTDSPSGLNFDLRLPQNFSPNGLAEANLKNAAVTLPPGMTVNPSSANGLQGCSSMQIDLHSAEPAHCPDASKIGSVEVDTPLLDHPLPGAVYLAQPYENPFGSGEHPGGSLLAIYIVVDDPVTGVVVKLAGHVEANPNTGQLTTTFAENPQLPFTDLKLKLFGGPRAPLVTPSGCGTYTTTTNLTGWNEVVATPSDSFAVASDCGAGFAPSFSAGSGNGQAGGFAPLSVTLSRQDGEQRLGGVTVRMPPGLLGKIAGIPQCPEAQANAGTCAQASQVGTASAGAGAGPEPFFVPEAGQPANPVYLTGPYKGAPFGLSIVTHALAGPFDLGNVIVRAAIYIDPRTAQVTVVSDPLPTILQGVQLDLRTVNVTIDRPGFTFNPTSCTPMSVTGTITSTSEADANVASPFQVANCANLRFKPSFTASTQGKTSKANGASLVVKVAQKPGEANIHKVDLTLPLALPARLTTLQKACTEAQFNSNPAGCPQGSFIGTATAVTPVLDMPLTGPAILVSHGGAAFPDVIFLLQGEGVRIELDGGTDIKKGITYSRFETVPDAPISSFATTLPEGPHSALSANGDLCKPTKVVTIRKRVAVHRHGHVMHVLRKIKQLVPAPLLMPTVMTGQNGAVVAQNTRLAVSGCTTIRHKQAKKHQKTTKKGRQ